MIKYLPISPLAAAGNGLLAAVMAGCILIGFLLLARLFAWQPFLELLQRVRLLDETLVRSATFATGTRYSAKRRWHYFLAWSVLACVAVCFGSPPVVLGGLIFGFFFVYFVVRHWLWDEGEREQNIKPSLDPYRSGSFLRQASAKRIDVSVDLNIETAVSFLLLIFLEASGFARLDHALGILNGSIVTHALRSAAYVIAEIPESSPIFDATSVFRNGNLSGVSYSGSIIKISTLLLRLIYELFLVVSLLRFARVLQRTYSHADLRRVEASLETPSPERRASAINRLAFLGQRGQDNAVQMLEEIAIAPANRSAQRFHLEEQVQAAFQLELIGRYRERADILLRAAKALRLLADRTPRSEQPYRWAMIQSVLGEALCALGEREGDPTNLKAAIEATDLALQIFSPIETPNDWAMAMGSRTRAIARLGERVADPAQIQTAVDQLEADLQSEFDEGDNSLVAYKKVNLAAFLTRLYERDGREDHLRRAIELCNSAIEALQGPDYLIDLGMAQVNLGGAQTRLAQHHGDKALSEEAVTTLRVALRNKAVRANPYNSAIGSLNLGQALVLLSEHGGSQQLLTEALNCLHRAVGTLSRDAEAYWRSGALANLGMVLVRLGEREASPERFIAAAECLEESSDEAFREGAPLLWAVTQINRGTCYLDLAEYEPSSGWLDKSADCYRAATEELGRTQVSRLWAAAQCNLANALIRLGVRDSRANLLEEAVTAAKAAAEVCTREDASFQWASIQVSIGNAYNELGLMLGRLDFMEEGLSAFKRARDELSNSAFPMQAAMAEYNIGIALFRMGAYRNDIHILRQSVEASRAALKVRTKVNAPSEWALSKLNLGIVLGKIGEMGGGREEFYESLGEIREAIAQWSKLGMASYKSLGQLNLGFVLWKVGDKAADIELLEESIVSSTDALKSEYVLQSARTKAGALYNRGGALSALGKAGGDVRNLRKAIADLEQATSISKLTPTPDRYVMLVEYGVAMLRLGMADRDLSTLRKSAEICADADGQMPDGRAQTIRGLNKYNWGTALLLASTIDDAPELLERGVEALVGAVQILEAQNGPHLEEARNNLALGVEEQRKRAGGAARPTPASELQPVTRNALCPCGSGLRYKHCHGQRH